MSGRGEGEMDARKPDRPMNILLANPNTSQSVTDRIAAVARAVAAPGTEIVAGDRGNRRAIHRHAGGGGDRRTHHDGTDGRARRRLRRRHRGRIRRPGGGGAREAMAVPVIGMAEAAMLTACMLGRRFAIVTFATAFAPWYRECVEYNGLIARLAALRILDAPFSGIDTVQAELEAALVALCCRTATEDEADVVILGGAPLAGMARRVADRVPVPLVDGVEAAVLQAEALVRLSPRKPTAGSFRRPAPKPSTGLPPPLTAMLDWTTPPTK